MDYSVWKRPKYKSPEEKVLLFMKFTHEISFDMNPEVSLFHFQKFPYIDLFWNLGDAKAV